MICTEYRQSPIGPKRKYFSITDAGRKQITAFYEGWKELSSAVDTLFNG